MLQQPVIIFVCEHGAAKSIVAAAYFNQLAKDASLNWRAMARGTNPDTRLLEEAVRGLAKDGLISTEPTPQLLSIDDVQWAQRMISFCELPAEYGTVTVIEQWNDVPPISQDYNKARDVILEHLHELINKIRSSA